MPVQKHQYPNFYAYRLMVNERNCTDDEKRQFFHGINELYRKKEVTVVYRGESHNRMLKRYGTEQSSLFNDRLFVIGNKGKAFQRDRRISHKLNDNSQAFFENIFNWHYEVLKNENDLEGGSYRAIERFKKRNPAFAEYFRYKENKKEFLKHLRQVTDQNEKSDIKNHYLTLLQHTNRSGFFKNSFYVSTSRNWATAQNFSGKRKNQMILVGWATTLCLHNLAGSYSYPNQKRDDSTITLLKKHDLPCANKSYYPGQNEISLKGGLPPHYLVGYYHNAVNGEEFHINPALFNTSNNWVDEGLPIDQTRFYEQLAETEMDRAYQVYPSGHIFDEFLGWNE